MFGDQDSLAAQLFAGAKAGTKAPAAGNADGKAADAGADSTGQAQAQGLAAGFLTAPVALVDQAQTAATAADGAAVDPNAGGKTSSETVPVQGAATQAQPADAPAQTQIPAQAKDAASAAQANSATPAPAADAKPPPQPAAVLAAAALIGAQANAKTGDAKDASAQAPAPGQTAQTPATTAVAAAASAQANVKAAAAAEKPASPAAGDKAVKAADPIGPAAGPQAAVVQAAADANAQGGPGTGADKDGKPALPQAEAPKEAAAADRRDAAQPLQLQAPAAAQAAPATPEATPVKATSETVARLAAQISKQLEGRSTQFDIQLSPAGLGHVGVRVEISAHGQLTAAMSFDNAHAAAEVRSRAAELTRALEQAGFDVSGGLSFDVASDQGRSGYSPPQQNNDDGSGSWRGRAFQAALSSAGDTIDAAVSGALNLQRRSLAGVDIKI